MKCECGREIKNVPVNLKDLVKWQCKECSKSQSETKSTPLIKSHKPRVIFK